MNNKHYYTIYYNTIFVIIVFDYFLQNMIWFTQNIKWHLEPHLDQMVTLDPSTLQSLWFTIMSMWMKEELTTHPLVCVLIMNPYQCFISHWKLHFVKIISVIILNITVNCTIAGIFTAPVRGAYFFSFSGHNRSSKVLNLGLFKNEQQMVIAFNHPFGDRYESTANSISLTLERGDRVYVRLRETSWVFDNYSHHNSFVGHLLFPLWQSC